MLGDMSENVSAVKAKQPAALPLARPLTRSQTKQEAFATPALNPPRGRGQPVLLPGRGRSGVLRGVAQPRIQRGAQRPYVRPSINRGWPAPQPATLPQSQLPAQLAKMNWLSISKPPPVQMPQPQERKNKVTVELSQKQIDALKLLGML